jgi:hypothetical protein
MFVNAGLIYMYIILVDHSSNNQKGDKADSSSFPPNSSSLETLAKSRFWSNLSSLMQRLPALDGEAATNLNNASELRSCYQLKEEKDLTGFQSLSAAYVDSCKVRHLFNYLYLKNRTLILICSI